MKKIMCFMLFVTIALQGWSQELHVASGGVMYVSSESYVYVDDDVDVVSGGDLTINSDATHSGSFLVTGSATGDISYQRYVTGNRWHFVSAPVTTQAIGDFATEAANDVGVSSTGNYGISFYKNDNAQGTRWQYYTVAAGALGASTAGNFVSGKGYSNYRGSDGLYTFTGEMATAGSGVNITIPAESIAGADANSHLWSVVGNPYPSFIDASALLAANIANLDPSYAYLQVWDGSGYEQINFASDSQYIAPGQAFMVDPSDNNTIFTFTESLQSEQKDATATYYKTAATPKVVIQLTNESGIVKETTLKYFDTTTTGLDIGWDAGTYTDTDPTFSIDTHLVSDSQGINFTLQCLPNSNYEASIVPLSITAGSNEVLTFSAAHIGLPEGMMVYLEDKQNNTITDISSASYQLTTGKALNGIGRFYIHTSSSVLAVDSNSLLANTISIYKTNNSNLRIAGLTTTGTATLKMYTTGGKEILKSSFEAASVNDVALPAYLAKGVYLVQLVTNSNQLSKKIIIE